MMIRQRTPQKIPNICAHLHHHLRPASVLPLQISLNVTLANPISGQIIAVDFEDGNRLVVDATSNSDTLASLEVGCQVIAACERSGDGAMRESDCPRIFVDICHIGHKARKPSESFRQQHRECCG